MSRTAAADTYRKVMDHPIRMRILGLLRSAGEPRTQRELGRELSLSNASVHYHLNRLVDAGIVRLVDTRTGPNSIVEKLYAADEDAWNELQKSAEDAVDDMDFFLQYTLSWIQERNREGAELLRQERYANPFHAGSFVVGADWAAVIELQRRMGELLTEFFEAHRDAPADAPRHAVTFSVFPSHAEPGDHTHNVLAYEPEDVLDDDAHAPDASPPEPLPDKG